jgi:hypothetical protein
MNTSASEASHFDKTTSAGCHHLDIALHDHNGSYINLFAHVGTRLAIF